MTMSDVLRIPAPAHALRSWGAVPTASQGFTLDPRFARTPATPAPDFAAMPEPEREDPIERARAEGYAAGHEAALTEAQAQAAAQDAARHRLDSALRTMEAAQVDALEQRLRQTVLALCDSVLGDVAIDPAALETRVRRAAQMLPRAEDARVIRLHPEDLALIGHSSPPSMSLRGSRDCSGKPAGLSSDARSGGAPRWLRLPARRRRRGRDRARSG